MLLYLLQGFSLGISAAAMPGVFQAFLIGQALKSGWRRALPAACAPLLSDGPIILLMVGLLARLPDGALRAIRLAGGLFVLYLAYQALRALRAFRLDAPQAGTGASLRQAVLTNLLSPGPYIFWSTLAGPALVGGWKAAPAYGLAFVLSFYTAMIGGLAGLVIVFGAARRLGGRVSRALLGVSGLAMLGFGLYQLWQGIFPG